MDVCARKERRKERDILINYLIQIQISVGMLELKISVHVWKEEKEIILLNYLLWLQITITRLVVALDSSLDISFFFFFVNSWFGFESESHFVFAITSPVSILNFA